MNLFRALGGCVPGIGPLAAAGIGAHAGLLSQPEPEIPTALDDWDREFEERTGDLPSFSRLARARRLHEQTIVRATLRGYRPQAEIEDAVGDALSWAGKR